jgi:hypothetical protein
MKKMLPLIFLFPTLLFAQEKKNFIKEFLYVKVSPTLFVMWEGTDRMQDENALEPAVFGAVGVKSRYAAVGFSAGYLKKMKYAGEIDPPYGVDLTFTDFKRKKAFPVITAHWHKVHFKELQWERLSRYSSHTYIITGQQMFGISGGIAFRVFKKQKMMITAGYSKLKGNTVINYSSAYYGPTTYSTTTGKDHYNMAVLAASVVF